MPLNLGLKFFIGRCSLYYGADSTHGWELNESSGNDIKSDGWLPAVLVGKIKFMKQDLQIK